MRRHLSTTSAILLLGALVATATQAQSLPPGASQVDASSLRPASKAPGPLKDVGFDQRLGEPLPLDAAFRDESGREVRLGDYFGERPVVLSLVYYECPMLCPMTLIGLASSLKVLRFGAGEEFDVVVVSFDPGEGAEAARTAKDNALARYGREGAEDGWHFLTGDEDSIRRLTDAVGFRYVYLPEKDEFAHAAGAVLVTPQGQVARYFFGIEYPPKDLRLGLVEAADGKIGSVVDELLLYCFHYDPAIGRYSAVTMNILRVAGAVTVLTLGLFVAGMLWRERKNRLRTA